MDNDVLAYRVLLEKRKENAPFWEKKVLTVEEAAEYTGIGRTKIRLSSTRPMVLKTAKIFSPLVLFSI